MKRKSSTVRILARIVLKYVLIRYNIDVRNPTKSKERTNTILGYVWLFWILNRISMSNSGIK